MFALLSSSCLPVSLCLFVSICFVVLLLVYSIFFFAGLFLLALWGTRLLEVTSVLWHSSCAYMSSLILLLAVAGCFVRSVCDRLPVAALSSLPGVFLVVVFLFVRSVLVAFSLSLVVSSLSLFLSLFSLCLFLSLPLFLASEPQL